MGFARRFEDLVVYQLAFKAAGRIFLATKTWPTEERYGLTSQIRNSSRSVCGNIAEAWRKRRYPNHFVSKLTDADGEASETQNWLKFAVNCEYLASDEARELYGEYDKVSAGLVEMMSNPQRWCGPSQLVREEFVSYDAGKSSLSSQVLADWVECERRRLRLREPHVEPLTRHVAELRTKLNKAEQDIPDFDPEDAGVEAQILLVLQDPGNKAIQSGFVSRDNPDFTALCINRSLLEAGLLREHYAIWNLVPWRGPYSSGDIEAGRSALASMVSRLPNLKVVVPLGKQATRGIEGITSLKQRGILVVEGPHPSPLNIRTRPEARAKFVESLVKASRLARISPDSSVE